MSYEIGMAALKLEMPPRIPRTEYSIFGHFDLLKKVTGIDVDYNSPPEIKRKAKLAFLKAWPFDIFWATLINGSVFGEKRAQMGHGTYAKAGTDFNPSRSQYFSDPEEIFSIDFDELYGVPDHNKLKTKFEEHYQKQIEENPDGVNMTGIYITLISGIIDICGWELFLTSAGVDPHRFGETVNRYANWIQRYFNALAESTVPVVMVHDDIVWSEGAFIHPDWYRKFVFPNYKKLILPLKEAGKIVLFTSDGNYTEFIDDIASCGVNGFVLEPLTDLKYIVEHYGETHIIIGNADVRILYSGPKEKIEAEVRRCIELGKKCPGYFMAVGNHIPADVPVENVIWYNECYLRMSKR